MANDPQQPIVLVLPRFSLWMKRLAIYTAASWGALLLLGLFFRGAGPFGPLDLLSLRPSRVVPGWEVWRVLTYPLLQDPREIAPLFHILVFWTLGSPVEQAQGPRRTLGLAAAGVAGGAIAALVASRLSIELFHESVVGVGPIADALLVGWGFTHARERVSFFGIGPLKGQHLAIAFAAIAVIAALTAFSLRGAASLGGLLGGAAWGLAIRGSRGGGAATGRKRRTSGSHLRAVDSPKKWLN